MAGTLSHWVWRGTPDQGCSPWSRSICTQLPEPTAGSRTQLYAPLQDSQQHQSLSTEHKRQNSSGSAKALAVPSKPPPPPFLSKTFQYSQVRFLRLTPILVLLSEQEIASLSLWELVIMREACDWIHLPHKTKLLPLNPGTGTVASR